MMTFLALAHMCDATQVPVFLKPDAFIYLKKTYDF